MASPSESFDPALADALRRAVERNRKACARPLRESRGSGRVALTASNEAQAASYREEIDERRSLGLLSLDLEVLVIADPPGERPGSGGATFNALRRLEVRPNERVLLLHCGGESRRFPAYGPPGKLFAPLPCPRADGRTSTVFDEILTSLAPLVAKMPPGWLVASADVLLLFNASRIAPRPGSVTGLGFSVDAQTAKGHGVYVPGRDGGVKAFLQKPSMGLLQESGALDADGAALVDTGVFIFPHEIVERLDALSRSAVGERPSDLYEDWVLPMIPSVSREEYRKEGDSDAREALWEVFRPVPLALRIARPSRFIHLGTTKQWRDALLNDPIAAHALGFDPSFRSRSDIEPAGESVRLLHARIFAANRDGTPAAGSESTRDGILSPGAVAESCRLAGGFFLGERSTAIHVHDETGSLLLPPDCVIDQLPVALDDGSEGWATRVYPLEMDPKAKGEGVSFFGRAATDWLASFGLPASAAWEERADARASMTLWNARLFPVARTREESLARAAWLLARAWDGREPPSFLRDALKAQDSPENFDLWRSGRRYSFEECQDRADRACWRSLRRDLERETIVALAKRALERDEDARSLELASSDFPSLVAELEPLQESDPLRSPRVCWLLADLLDAAESRTKESRIPIDSPLSSKSLRDEAFSRIALAVDRGAPQVSENPRLALPPGRSAFADAPLRLDFAGGWSDTPPYSLDHGGAVLNAAILLDGERPIRAWARRVAEPELRFSIRDPHRAGKEAPPAAVVSRLSEALSYRNPSDPFALHKAAVALMRIVTPEGGSLRKQMERFGGGLELVTESAAPKGSGLGASSILGGVILAALGRATGAEFDDLALFDLTLALEQHLTTGGGWQDQVGGLAGGWKVVRTEPGLKQTPSVETLTLSEAAKRGLRERAFLMYSGYARLARNILRNMVGRYLSRDERSLSVLHGMRPLVDRMTGALLAADFDAMGRAMDDANASIARIDPQSWPPHITEIVDAVRPRLSGAKPAGAGGGGFLAFLAKSAEDRIRAEETLASLDLPQGARTYPLEVSEDGLRVSVVEDF